MTTQRDRIEAAIRHIKTSVDIDPWAMELAVEALKAQIDKDTNVPNTDCISRQPKQDIEFMKLTVRNSNGRPYYSIIYLEFDDNGVGRDLE